MKSKKYLFKKIIVVGMILTVGLSQHACGTLSQDSSNVKYIVTTGFAQDEIFRIEDQSCYKAEMMLYLTNMQNKYENVYGSQIWEANSNNITLEDNVKDVVLAKLAQLKCMQLLAREYQITLTEEETNKVKVATNEYYEALTEEEIAAMGINKDTVELLYREYLLATKVYEYMIQDVNPEISDDEARSIKVQSILIKTNYVDENGKLVPYSEEEKKEAKQKALTVVEKVEEGIAFDELVDDYNEDSQSIYSFGKGDMEEAFETAAYNLDTDEVSGVVETQYGYHIIKCLSTFDEMETNANKQKILTQRKNEAFNEAYQEYVLGLSKYINEESFEDISLLKEENVTTSNLFEVYGKYFSEV